LPRARPAASLQAADAESSKPDPAAVAAAAAAATVAAFSDADVARAVAARLRAPRFGRGSERFESGSGGFEAAAATVEDAGAGDDVDAGEDATEGAPAAAGARGAEAARALLRRFADSARADPAAIVAADIAARDNWLHIAPPTPAPAPGVAPVSDSVSAASTVAVRRSGGRLSTAAADAGGDALRWRRTEEVWASARAAEREALRRELASEFDGLRSAEDRPTEGSDIGPGSGTVAGAGTSTGTGTGTGTSGLLS
jgi:hypothetical protein